jgi:hypothetical protein
MYTAPLPVCTCSSHMGFSLGRLSLCAINQIEVDHIPSSDIHDKATFFLASSCRLDASVTQADDAALV